MTADVDSPIDPDAVDPEAAARFRFPAADDPAPGTRRLLIMSIYASALGLAGIGVGVRGFVSVLGGAPGWYMPLLALLGLMSVALMVGGFLSIHRRRTPYLMLAAGAVPLAGAVALSVAY